MKRVRTDEAAYLATFAVLLSILLPVMGELMGKYGGGIAILSVVMVGGIGYLKAFGARMRRRGQVKLAAAVALASLLFGAAMAMVSPLLAVPWD